MAAGEEGAVHVLTALGFSLRRMRGAGAMGLGNHRGRVPARLVGERDWAGLAATTSGRLRGFGLGSSQGCPGCWGRAQAAAWTPLSSSEGACTACSLIMSPPRPRGGGFILFIISEATRVLGPSS